MIYNFTNFIKEREGSDIYGGIINDIMLVLRNYKIDINVDEIVIPSVKLHTDINKLNMLKKRNYRTLISFDFEFLDNNKHIIDKYDENGYIRFYNLNNGTKISRPWENLKYNNF
jgi:hypothetical protein